MPTAASAICESSAPPGGSGLGQPDQAGRRPSVRGAVQGPGADPAQRQAKLAGGALDAEGRCERNCPDFERDPLFSTVLARRLLGAEPWPEAMPGNAETSRTPLHSRAVYLSPHSRPYAAGAGAASL